MAKKTSSEDSPSEPGYFSFDTPGAGFNEGIWKESRNPRTERGEVRPPLLDHGLDEEDVKRK